MAAALGLLAAGCVLKSSPPARLYVLDAVAPPGPAASGAPRSVVGVLRVTVPDWIERPEITSRAAGGRIAPDDLARWGEPVARGMQRVLTENLAALLPDRLVVRAPTRRALDQRLEVEVSEAARQADGSVLVEARWAVFAADGTTLLQRRSSHRAGPAADAAGIARGLSEALGALSGEIAEALRAEPIPSAGRP